MAIAVTSRPFEPHFEQARKEIHNVSSHRNLKSRKIVSVPPIYMIAQPLDFFSFFSFFLSAAAGAAVADSAGRWLVDVLGVGPSAASCWAALASSSDWSCWASCWSYLLVRDTRSSSQDQICLLW